MTPDKQPASQKIAVLVIDDESQIRRYLRVSLSGQEYQVTEASNGADGVRKALAEAPDVVVLDLGLPDCDGKEVIRRIRESSAVPIVILSVRSDESEKIEALDAGADDYIEKPFATGELLARIRTALRRRVRAEAHTTIVTAGAVSIDLERRLVLKKGEEVRLTPREWDLLSILATHAGRVVTHPQLLREIRGEQLEDQTHYLRVFISQLRQKLEADPSRPRIIVTEAGVGYRLVSEG